MPGALLQLVAKGPQDEYINQENGYSFFQYDMIAKCHTNFALESIPQNFDTDVSAGKRMTATIQRQGDLLMGLNLHIQFQNHSNLSGLSVATLPERLGLKIIDYVELMIGQVKIDRMYGDWMNMWGQLTQSGAYQRKWRRLVSGRELYQPDDSVYSGTPNPLGPNGNGTLAIVPLPFWFTRNPGLALPLVALQFHDVECVVQLNAMNCVVPLQKFNTIDGLEITGMELYADFVFLDVNERRTYAQNSHSYLMEQTQFNQINSINLDMTTDGTRVVKFNEDLRFSHPVKELFWIVKRKNNANAPRDAYDYFSEYGTDMCISAQLDVNGSQRERERQGTYYRLEHPYRFHSGGDGQEYWESKVANTTAELGGYYVYSFALEPESVYPSGAMNFSRVDSATLKLSLHPSSDTIEVFARSYNILRISQGMGGVVFSN